MSSQWKVGPPDLYGCTLWLGQLDQDGYPILWQGRGKPPVRAHRKQYEERHGPLKPGEEIEHACKRRACMTDAHHEVVTRAQNVRLIRWRHRVRKERCSAGHDLYLHGSVTPEGGRICRTCSRGPNFFDPSGSQPGGGP